MQAETCPYLAGGVVGGHGSPQQPLEAIDDEAAMHRDLALAPGQRVH